MAGFIKYKPETGTNDDGSVAVYMFRKRIGTICKEKAGYRYYPIGHKTGGDLLPTVRAVKNSLEAE